jgi:capreomycidine synthase
VTAEQLTQELTHELAQYSPGIGRLRPAPLEDWLRDYYFTADLDISSSGVQPYSMAELRQKTGLSLGELDALEFSDGYSLGAMGVRAEIARRWGDGDLDKVMTTSGSSEAISLVLTALIRPSDEVVVVQPGYHLLTEFVTALGCRTRAWNLDAGNGWSASLDELADLVTERTRAIVVNFPHNPTGASISEDELRGLVRIANRVGAYILWDAAFADLVYDADPLLDVSLLYHRGISFGTFSKAFGLAGLRFGWCVAPPDVLTECVRIRDYTTLHLSPLVELLAQHVLENADRFLVPRLEQARLNRKLLRDWADSQSGAVRLDLPTGGVAAFPRLERVPDVDQFCEDLLRKHGVLLIPGSCFGVPQHVRLGFGGATDELARGLEILGDQLAAVPTRPAV